MYLRLSLGALLFLCSVVKAQNPISGITTSSNTATSTSYTATSPADAMNSINVSTSYQINNGTGTNIGVSAYTIGGSSYSNFLQPDSLVIRRTDGGSFLNVWYTMDQINSGTSPATLVLEPDRANDLEAMYQAGNVNTGFDDLLINTDDIDGYAPPQVERVDVLWYSGMVSCAPANVVFTIIERGGDDDIRVAAITALDVNGDPSAYGSTVLIEANDWPQTGSAFSNFMVLRRTALGQNPLPLLNRGVLAGQSSEVVQGMAVSLQDLGVSSGQVIYGYSIFAADTDESNMGIDLTDIATFPTNTVASDSGLDLVAGLSAAVSDGDCLIEAVGPGGYQASLVTWLKADEGALTTAGGSTPSDGGSAGFWEDQSVGNYDFENTGVAPFYRSSSSTINFNPTIDFVASSQRDLSIEKNEDYNFKAIDSGFEKKMIHLAFRTGSDIQIRQQLLDHAGDVTGISAYVESGNLYASAWQRTNVGSGSPWNDAASTVFLSKAVAADTEYVLSLEFEGNVSVTGTLKAYLNGDQFGILSSVGLLFNEKDDIGIGDATGTSRYEAGTQNADSFEGEISEFVYINEPSSISSVQRKKTESYLALKYGITLDQSSAQDYYNSAGNVVFDATNPTALGGFLSYNSNIAGIARDDDSELLQASSKSEHPGDVLSISRNGGFSTDNTWFMWGHDGDALTLQNTDVPVSVTNRLSRVWRVAETNDAGLLELTFDLTGLGLSTDPADFSLLVASSGSNGSFSSSSIISGGSMNGFLLTFTGVSLSNGEFITLSAAANMVGPGGVANNLSFWIKANDGTNTTTDGVEVTSWSDQLGLYSASATAGTAPVYVESGANYNPGITFNGTDELMSATGGLNTVTYYLVIRPDNAFSTSTTAETPLGFEVSSTAATNNVGGLFLGDQFGAATLITHLVGTGTTLYARGLSGTSVTLEAGKPYVLGVRTNAGSTETEISLNGLLVDNGGFSTLLEAVNEPYTLGRFGTNNQGLTNWFDGEVLEVFSYTARPSDTEIQQIESYLSLKYGVTLDQTSPQNYLRSDASIIWNATDASGYTTDIAGIMQDDNSGLLQKQARSQNDGAILTVGVGTLSATNAANNGTFPQDGAFWIWGHNTGAVTKASVINTDLPIQVTERTPRVWRISTSEPSQNLSFSFDLTGLGYTLNADDFSLILSGTSNMVNGVSHTGAVINGNEVTFSNINIPVGNNFISLGTGRTICGPGGVATDLELWLRADEGTNTTTDGGSMTDWADQSAQGRDAITVDLGGGSPVAPTYESEEMNFNPGIRFYDANSTNSSYMKTTNGNDVDSQFMIFAVYKSTQTDGTANSMTNSPALVGADVSGDADYGMGIQDGKPWLNADNTNTFSIQSTTQYNDDEPLILSAFRTFSGFGNFGVITVNSEPPIATSVSTTTLSSPTDFGIGNHSSPTTAAQFNGVIGDVLVYSSVKGFEDRIKIESHLAIRYGITRNGIDDTNSVGLDDRDYLISNGSSVWDYDVQGSTYYNDIAGIGIDNGGCLLQLKSKSNNDDARVTISVSSFTNDNSFLLWGNDNAALEDSNNRDFDESQVKSRLNREWRVQESGVVNQVSLEFDLTGITGPTGINTNDLSQVVLMTDADGDFTGGASIFSPASTSGNTVSFLVDLANGDYFTIGSTEPAALPIVLNSFEARANEGDVLLQWETSSETDNAFYTIERSANGIDFESIAYLDGAGTSSAVNQYEYVDLSPGEGVYYYRLKQTDFNGTFTHSEVLRVEVVNADFELRFYPNPVKSGIPFVIEFKGVEILLESIQIMAVDGRLARFVPMESREARLIRIDTQGLQPGLYLIRLLVNGQVMTHRLIIE
ncbi:MAG: T9SS type A sorting domain-containing protein [Roseivirga sp.]|nr:T9SS type A sorting domain-containing protein [Roseivirga sp.]